MRLRVIKYDAGGGAVLRTDGAYDDLDVTLDGITQRVRTATAFCAHLSRRREPG